MAGWEGPAGPIGPKRKTAPKRCRRCGGEYHGNRESRCSLVIVQTITDPAGVDRDIYRRKELAR